MASVSSAIKKVVARTQPHMAKVFRPDSEGLLLAARMLQSGGCVAFPTETVYGLGANALNEEAVQSIFTHKGRPLSDPLIVHVTSKEAALQLLRLPATGTALFSTLADRFWPGPLTIVGRAADKIPLKVTASTGFVGIRVPEHPVARALIDAARLPIAAPSANRFGHVSPTKACHVMQDLGHCPIGIVDGDGSLLKGGGGPSSGASTSSAVCSVGIESTVMKIEDMGGEPGTDPGETGSTGGSVGLGGEAAASGEVTGSKTGSGLRVIVYRRGGVSLRALRSAMDEAGFESVGIKVVSKAAKSHADPGAGSGASVGSAAIGGAAGGGGSEASVVATDSSVGGSSGRAGDASAGDGGTAGASAEAESGGQEAPGQLLTHYAPDKPTYLVVGRSGELAGGGKAAVVWSSEDGGVEGGGVHLPPVSECIVIDAGGWLSGLKAGAAAYLDMAPGGDLAVGRRGVFEALRWTEGQPGSAVLIADPMVIPGVREHEDCEAVRDRVFRAASGRTVRLRQVALSGGDGP